MKENKYDNNDFFEKYSRFPRSVKGLSAAGEWHELQKLLPDFKGKRVLDLGCGFGWHCIYAAENGADYVLGTDISEKMLNEAERKTNFDNVEYRRIPMEDISYPENAFDVVISSLAFHYVKDFESICQNIYKILSPKGSFVFSVEHPVFTAQGTQDWIYDGKGNILHWPVDNYFIQGRREAVFLGEPITKYHKTLTTYLNSLLKAGFKITSIVEPEPSSELLETVEGMKEELRRPMMLLVSAIK